MTPVPAADPAPTQEELLRAAVDTLQRTIVHYALWWKEVERQFGAAECTAIAAAVWEQWFPLQLTRIGQSAGFAVRDGLPTALTTRSAEELRGLLEALSVNWLASDGVWFQAVEKRHGLAAAQQCNDAAWGVLSPFEAARIKALLGLPDNGGLDALDCALRHRMYAHINRYSIERPNRATLILRMNDCRVQSARRRKGLADYPCKSGGTIEYETFARAIDPRIRTECIGCPPDPHPDDWFCAWRFTLGA